mgnify:CR=1 FL=1
MPLRQLGQILVDMGFIDDDQLVLTLEEQQQRPGELLGHVAEELGLITDVQLSQALAEQMDLQVIELGAGAALAWGWKESTDWNVTGSASIGSVRGRLQFADAALQFPGVVLFFDGEWTLVAKEEGFLSELLLRPQLPRFVEDDSSPAAGA